MIQLINGNYLGWNRSIFSISGVLVSETCYDTPVFEGWHAHENPHITFTLTGGNREERRKYDTSVSAGQVLFYNSGEAHRNYGTQHPSKNINLEIEAAFFTAYDLHPSCFEQQFFAADAKFLMLKIFNECRKPDAGQTLFTHSLLLRLISNTETKMYTKAKWASQLKALLHDEWNKELSLKYLAANVGVHPVTISKYFAQYFGCNLGDYVRKVRIGKAIELMCATDSPLTHIAHYSGFYDQSHFIRAFRKYIGMAPKMLKKLQR